MANPSRPILAVSLLAAGAACIASLSAPSAPAPGSLHEALTDLRQGRGAQAERQAYAMATAPVSPSPRAWLVVAEARLADRKYASAARAYRMFLAQCASIRLREYALAQIRRCEQLAKPASPARSPGEQLTAEQRKALAVVDTDTHAESTHHFVVRARNAALAKLVATQAEAALERICQVILAGQEFPHSVDVYVWADAADYQKNARGAHEWSGGSFSVDVRNGAITRRIDLTQLDAKRAFDLAMLDRVLPHELCHLVLYDFFGDAPCPLFLNEGLAMLAEWRVDSNRVLLAGAAVASRKKISLERLLEMQWNDLTAPAVFYAEAFSFVDYLRDRLSDGQFRDVLACVKAGVPLEEAIQRAVVARHDPAFLTALAKAWEDEAIAQAQVLRALEVAELDSPPAPASPR